VLVLYLYLRNPPPGQGPLQPAVGDPALEGGLDWVTHRGPFQPLPFCDSVPVLLLPLFTWCRQIFWQLGVRDA